MKLQPHVRGAQRPQTVLSDNRKRGGLASATRNPGGQREDPGKRLSESVAPWAERIDRMYRERMEGKAGPECQCADLKAMIARLESAISGLVAAAGEKTSLLGTGEVK